MQGNTALCKPWSSNFLSLYHFSRVCNDCKGEAKPHLMALVLSTATLGPGHGPGRRHRRQWTLVGALHCLKDTPTKARSPAFACRKQHGHVDTINSTPLTITIRLQAEDECIIMWSQCKGTNSARNLPSLQGRLSKSFTLPPSIVEDHILEGRSDTQQG